MPSRRLNCFAALYATYSTRPRRSRYFPYVASKIAPATAFVSFRDAERFVSGRGGERRSREKIRRHRPSLLEGECRLVVSTRVSGFDTSPRFRVPAEGLPAFRRWLKSPHHYTTTTPCRERSGTKRHEGIVKECKEQDTIFSE